MVLSQKCYKGYFVSHVLYGYVLASSVSHARNVFEESEQVNQDALAMRYMRLLVFNSPYSDAMQK